MINNMVICKKCYVNFEYKYNCIYTQQSEHCKQHDFIVPDHLTVTTINEPCFFIRKKTTNELNEDIKNNAKTQLKQRLVALLYDFTSDTCSPNNPLYPFCLPIMEDCLSECLDEIKLQYKKS